MSSKTPCVQCGSLWYGEYCRSCSNLNNHINRIENQFGQPIKEIIQDLYFSQRKTYTEICEMFGLQYRSFRRIMDHLDLKLRTRSNAVKLQWERDDGTRSEMTSKMFKDINDKLDNFGENNPAKRPDVRKKISKVKKVNNPGILAARREVFRKQREGIPNSIEKAMMEALDRANIKYEREFRVWKYCLDFALVSCKVAIECDGVYWHNLNPEKDARRDAKLGGFGWITYRFTGDEIREDVDACVQKVVKDLASQGINIPENKRKS